jgi:hypothetical protein
MIGCRHNAKNTLVKNYLYFAEKMGAEVRAETEVVNRVPLRALRIVGSILRHPVDFLRSHVLPGWARQRPRPAGSAPGIPDRQLIPYCSTQ